MRLPFLGTLFFVLTLVLAGFSSSRSLEQEARTEPDFSVLVFTKAEGYRHASIEEGVAALKSLGDRHDFTVTATGSPAVFDPDSLARYGAVVFLNTTGDVLDAAQQAAFERYIQAGGGFVGIHAAADTEHDWPWYGDLVGAYVEEDSSERDLEVQEADVHVLDPAHPATAHLPPRWTLTDAWYNYQASPRGDVHVLATLEEQSYEGGTMGYDHPIAWVHLHDGGRAFYTGLGHTPEIYDEPLFLRHLLGGIRWAADVEEGDVGVTVAGSFEKAVLDEETTYPMELDVAPDGRVFWIERDGAVKIWDPETEATHLAAFVPVAMKIEDGLLGLALDPKFEENGWVYLYYTPLSEDPNRLSRFTVQGNRLDLSSEKIVLEVKMQRELCCHSAGGLEFGPDGTLYLSTGDNTGGGAPRTDERPGKEFRDAQRTTANTNDLRGKILRIRPEDDGSYTIPEGNLFEDDDPLTRPEIYTMGHRNPWRLSIDPETGWLYWGDVGPGHEYEEGKRPLGVEEFGQAKGPGFFGWPYFVGPNEPYRDLDYETETYGDWYDPERPINDSPNNTGIRELPPAQPPWIWYHYYPTGPFPEMGAGGMSAAAGPFYEYDPETVHPKGLPAYYDGKFFIFEWARGWIQEVTRDEEGDPLGIIPFAPEIPLIRPIDVAIGPEGRLFALEWGNESWGQTRDAKLVRFDYYGSPQRPPAVVAAAEPNSGPAPLRVSFSGSESRNLSGDAPLDYAWDFDGDGTVEARTANPTYTYEEPGTFAARLAVTGAGGMTSEEEVAVTVGNAAPEVLIAWPPEGGFFDFNEPIAYEVDVTDREDGTVVGPGPRVTVQPHLGHDTHTHPLHTHRGRTGEFVVVPDSSHRPYIIDHFVELEASYTDEGAPSAEALTGRDRILLRPKVVEAENYTEADGARLVVTANRQLPTFAEETEVFVELGDGGYASLAPVDLYGIDALTLRVVPEARGSVEVRLGGPDGRLLAEAPLVPASEEVQEADAQRARTLEEQHDVAARRDVTPKTTGWTDVRLPVSDPGGTQALYFVFRGPAGAYTVAKFDRIVFEGPGVITRAGYDVSTAQ